MSKLLYWCGEFQLVELASPCVTLWIWLSNHEFSSVLINANRNTCRRRNRSPRHPNHNLNNWKTWKFYILLTHDHNQISNYWSLPDTITNSHSRIISVGEVMANKVQTNKRRCERRYLTSLLNVSVSLSLNLDLSEDTFWVLSHIFRQSRRHSLHRHGAEWVDGVCVHCWQETANGNDDDKRERKNSGKSSWKFFIWRKVI